MELPEQKKTERRDGIWFLLILYCLGVVLNFALVLILAFLPNSHLDPIALVVLLVVTALRGVGIARLFCFKNDAWTYLVFALIIVLASDALDLAFGGPGFFMQRHAPFRTFLGYAAAVATILYAFRVSPKSALEKAPPL